MGDQGRVSRKSHGGISFACLNVTVTGEGKKGNLRQVSVLSHQCTQSPRVVYLKPVFGVVKASRNYGVLKICNTVHPMAPHIINNTNWMNNTCYPRCGEVKGEWDSLSQISQANFIKATTKKNLMIEIWNPVGNQASQYVNHREENRSGISEICWKIFVVL